MNYTRSLVSVLLLTLGLLRGQAQPRMANYEKDWKKADSLMANGLPQSALKIADRIYLDAKAARNYPQLVKAIIHRLSYRNINEEDTYVEGIESLKADIAGIPEPGKSILHTVLADLYWQYFQRNRYKFYNRATVEKSADSPQADESKFSQWDATRLFTEVTVQYAASIAQKDLLTKTPVDTYKALIDPGDAEARPLRPTLFDLLAHRALDFFRNTEPDVVKPTYRFEIDKADYFSDAIAFAKLPIKTPDLLSRQFRALLLYQELTEFHLADTDPLALADVDAARLRFVYEHSVMPDKEMLYQQALNRQLVLYKGKKAEAGYQYELARFLTDQGAKYHPLEQKTWSHKNERKQAADLCRDLVKRYPKSWAGQNAAHLLEQLTAPSLSVQVEEVTEPDKPFRARVEYQNVTKLFYRLYHLSMAERQLLNTVRYGSDDDKQKAYKTLLKHSIVGQNQTSLPDDGDLQPHAAEMPVNALPLGQYVLLVSADEKFTLSSRNLSGSQFTVSRLAYLTNNSYGSTDSQLLYVTDRQTGAPIADVQAQVYYYPNNQNTKGALKSVLYRTDVQGLLALKKSQLPANQNYWIQFSKGNDTLETDGQYNRPPYPDNTNDAVNPQILFFTDRAIYRPGQSIYYKGLIYSGQNNAFAVVPNRSIMVRFTDTNGEEVAKQTLTTNEFGTLTGSFTAPVGRLTGQMTIQCDFGQTTVRVEEYKRPTFAVAVNPVKGAVKLGQTVTITAIAKTLSGAVVDGASVRYRVSRTYYQLYPYWQGGYAGKFVRPVPGAGNNTEIANGTLTTSAIGQVSLTFEATPDRSFAEAEKPVFVFDITFDVTDRAGETRSATQTLRIGYTALQAALTIPEQVELGDKQAFTIRTTNSTGEVVPVKSSQIVIKKLTPPARALRSRLWQQPDRQLLTRDEFARLFPHDLYANENDPTTWPAQLLQTLQPDKAGSFTLSNLTPGEYRAEATVSDSTGETTKQEQFFSVVSDNVASQRLDQWLRATKTTAEPSEMAVFYVGNNQPGWVLMTIDEHGKAPVNEWIQTTGTPKRVTLPIAERHRGGFVVYFTMVQHGRLFTDVKTVQVPFTNKQLHIETQTFRDKLKPGQAEEWTLKISGPDKEKVLAELVATLYDASLDQFVGLDWPANMYQTYQSKISGWQSACFGFTTTERLFDRYVPGRDVVARRYDQLQSVSTDQYGGGRMYMAKGGVARMAAPMAMQDNVAAAAFSEKKDANSTEQPQQAANTPDQPSELPQPVVRKNFNETAFFFPQLRTDAEGRVVLTFTMPESLTRWRLLTFAHTKDLKIGSMMQEVVTQKELMITANLPRFLREGDTIQLAARINNLTDKVLGGTASIEAFDPFTNAPITTKLFTQSLNQPFTANVAQSTAVSWSITIPQGLEMVAFRVVARSGNFSDGEERVVPILPNRMLVTDTQPFWINGLASGGTATKTFTLTALTSLSPQAPVQHERLTVEVTSNPAWYALQSLPYLMEYPYECAEQLFSRLYANSLANRILTAQPAMRAVVEGWRTNPPTTPLEKNSELKAVALENTPWLADGRSEAERQAKLGQLLEQNRLLTEQQQAIDKLAQLQTPDGGFRWFSGMQPDLTMTLYLLGGFGHLQKLGVTFPEALQQQLDQMLPKAVQYVDNELIKWIAEQKKEKASTPLAYLPMQYLYARSFYPKQAISKTTLAYLKLLVSANWLKQSLQGQAMTALALNRLGDTATPKAILTSLLERARTSEELGTYWPSNMSGVYWYQAPIETQAYLIEAFGEISGDATTVSNLKRWLLRQKQTQSWSSTKATTEAIYALLLRGDSWLETKNTTTVEVSGKAIADRVAKTELATGYQKVSFAPSEIKPALGTIKISKTSAGPAWGAAYWQHFEPLDNVIPGSAGLSVQKTLFVQHDSPTGPVITPVTAKTSLKPGDLIKVRVVLTTDRAMEYVHLKDSRAAGFEPIATLSGYKYQNGLGYYEATRDASTDFFMNYVPVGTHVFEYELRVAQTGDFSAGVATIQCFYAPEFAAHSRGERVRVK